MAFNNRQQSFLTTGFGNNTAVTPGINNMGINRNGQGGGFISGFSSPSTLQNRLSLGANNNFRNGTVSPVNNRSPGGTLWGQNSGMGPVTTSALGMGMNNMGNNMGMNNMGNNMGMNNMGNTMGNTMGNNMGMNNMGNTIGNNMGMNNMGMNNMGNTIGNNIGTTFPSNNGWPSNASLTIQPAPANVAVGAWGAQNTQFNNQPALNTAPSFNQGVMNSTFTQSSNMGAFSSLGGGGGGMLGQTRPQGLTGQSILTSPGAFVNSNNTQQKSPNWGNKSSAYGGNTVQFSGISTPGHSAFQAKVISEQGGQGGKGSLSLQNICGMDQYANFSQEEIRFNESSSLQHSGGTSFNQPQQQPPSAFNAFNGMTNIGQPNAFNQFSQQPQQQQAPSAFNAFNGMTNTAPQSTFSVKSTQPTPFIGQFPTQPMFNNTMSSAGTSFNQPQQQPPSAFNAFNGMANTAQPNAFNQFSQQPQQQQAPSAFNAFNGMTNTAQPNALFQPQPQFTASNIGLKNFTSPTLYNQQPQSELHNPSTQVNTNNEAPNKSQDVSYLNISDSPSNFHERASLRRFSSMSAAKPTAKSTISNKSSISNSSKKMTDWTSDNSSHHDKYISNSSNASASVSASVGTRASIDDSVSGDKSHNSNFTEPRRTASAMLMSFGSASSSYMTSPPTPFSAVDTGKKTGLTPSNSDTPSDDRYSKSPRDINLPIQSCASANPEYQIFPSLEELKKVEQDRDFRYLQNVPDFTIKNAFGSIQWNGKVDVSGIDLDKAVSIEYGKVTVYGDNYSNKPPVGMKLNRAAWVTIFLNSDEAVTREDLVESNKESGARFISYVYDESINKYRWVFSVEHFSSHGLLRSKSTPANNPVGAPVSGGSSTPANNPVGAGLLRSKSAPANNPVGAPVSGGSSTQANNPVGAPVSAGPIVLLDSSKSPSLKILTETISRRPHLYDRSCFLRGSFRVGWGVDGKIAHVGQKSLFSGGGGDNELNKATSVYLDVVDTLRWSKNQIGDKKVNGASTVQFDKVLDKIRMFGKVVAGSRSNSPRYSLPDGTSNDSGEYKKFLDMILAIMQEYRQQNVLSKVDLVALQVTELINAVLGQEEPSAFHGSTTSPIAGNSCSQFYIKRHMQDERRVELLSRWFACVCQHEVDNNPGEMRYYKRIFNELSCRRINKAIDSAINAGLYRLATIIAQLDSVQIDAALNLQDQILEWEKSEILSLEGDGSAYDKLLHPEIRNIYFLVSGMTESADVRNIGWLRTLGILYWYSSPVEWVVMMEENDKRESNRFMVTLQRYDDMLNEKPPLVDPPVPKWKNDSDPLGSKVRDDGLFHLLKLLICPNGSDKSLASVLGNEGYTRDPLDYRISYLLLVLLSSTGVGGINMSSNSSAVIMQHLIFQLLSMGMVKEAIFIAMQVSEDSKRKFLVKDIINRSVSYDPATDSWLKSSVSATGASPKSLFKVLKSIDAWLADSSVWQYVIKDLQVPQEWVYEGLAYSFRNRYDIVSEREKSVAEAYCLQRAGLHDAAISVLNNHLCMWYLHPYQRMQITETLGEQYDLMSHLLRNYVKSEEDSRIVFKSEEDRFFVDYFYIAKKKYNEEKLCRNEVMELYENIYKNSNPRLSSVPSDNLMDGLDTSDIPTLMSVVRCTMGETLLKINDAPTSNSYHNIVSKYHLQGSQQLLDKVDFNIKQLLEVELAVSLRRACDRT